MQTLLTRGVLVIGLLFSVFVLNCAEAAAPTFKAVGKVVTADREAIAAANRWMAKIDAGNYHEAIEAFPPRIRRAGAAMEEHWIGYLRMRREPLGRPLSRELFRARFFHTMSGAPDGNYECLDYRTSCQRKKLGFEIVALTKESGHWQVSGYNCW
jgi:hypothetical protein